MRKENNLKKRYPDTDTFHWYNANPKGVITTDCVIIKNVLKNTK